MKLSHTRRSSARTLARSRRAAASRFENLEARCLLTGIVSYPIDQFALPQGITHDSTGAVWYADSQQGQITKVTLDINNNASYASYSVGGFPSDITFNPADGFLYVLTSDGMVDQVDTSGNQLQAWTVADQFTEYQNVPVHATIGGDGALWFTTAGTYNNDASGYDNSIGRLDISTGATQFYSIAPSGGQTLGITTDTTGNVWFTVGMVGLINGVGDTVPGSSQIGRFEVNSGGFVSANYYNVPTSQGRVIDIKAASDGSLWYLSSDDVGDPRLPTVPTPDLLGHITYNSGNQSIAVGEIVIPKIGDQSGTLPNALAIDGSGKVWFTEFLGNKVSSFNPSSGDFARYNVSGPAFLTVSGSNVWIDSPYATNEFGDPAPFLTRIDTNNVTASIISTNPDIDATVGVNFSGPLVAFASSTPGNFAYTIDYGNGQTASGTVTNTGAGSYIINGNTTYASEGTYNTRITIADANGETISIAGTAIVTAPVVDVPLVAQGINVAAQEDIAIAPNVVGVSTLVVATFTGMDAAYTALIHWGDSTTSVGTVVSLGGGNYYVKLPTGQQKVYANPGVYNITVDIANDTQSATAISTATIIDTPLVASQNLMIAALNGKKVNGIVATFTDDITAVISNFTATINWGDNSTSVGIIVKDTSIAGRFIVMGSHHYTGKPATYSVTTLIVNVLEVHSATATATVAF